MAQYLKHVLDDLSRFSPDARVEFPVDIQGVSPSSQVTITVLESEDAQNELIDENERLENDVSSLKDDIGELKDALKAIREALGESATNDSRVAAVRKIIDEGGC